MIADIEGIATFTGGCIVAGFCALHWKRRPYLHLVPFVYSFLMDAGFRMHRALPLEWQAPLFFGVGFYVIGWIAAYCARATPASRKD